MVEPTPGMAMFEQSQGRLAELQQEYEVGQRRLQELMAQEVALRETLLRISGAIQVLRELLGSQDVPAPGDRLPPDAAGSAPGPDGEPAAEPAAPRVLTVP